MRTWRDRLSTGTPGRNRRKPEADLARGVGSNPAVTVVIPDTDDPEHMVDIMGASRGELPDADLRRRIEQIFDELGG
jgi:hypothetical protein